MSTNLGMVALRAWIEERAVADGECWIWKGALHKGRPRGWFDGQQVYVRRAIVEVRSGEPLGLTRWSACTCDSPLCVRPEHIVGKTRSALMVGRSVTLPTRVALAESQRRRSKLNQEQVRQIREAEGKTAKELAEMFGVCFQYISMIRSQVRRRDYVATPFSGLLDKQRGCL